MKANIEVTLKPFTVPNFVGVETDPKPKEQGFQDGKSYALNELSADTLVQLCKDFTKAVFEKAGKQIPPQVSSE